MAIIIIVTLCHSITGAGSARSRTIHSPSRLSPGCAGQEAAKLALLDRRAALKAALAALLAQAQAPPVTAVDHNALIVPPAYYGAPPPRAPLFHNLQVIVYKMRPKKHYRRKNGHRQPLSKFMVTRVG